MTDNPWRRNRGAGQISSNTRLEQQSDGVLARKAAARMLALPRADVVMSIGQEVMSFSSVVLIQYDFVWIFSMCVDCLNLNSFGPTAKIFCLIHVYHHRVTQLYIAQRPAGHRRLQIEASWTSFLHFSHPHRCTQFFTNTFSLLVFIAWPNILITHVTNKPLIC